MQSFSTTTSKNGGIHGACSGAPCWDARQCRSKSGFCRSSRRYCNAESTWKASGCRSAERAEGGSRSGAACSGTGLCRSKWGHCGASPQHCNDESTWKASGCTQIQLQVNSVMSFNGANHSTASNDVRSLSKASHNLSNADIAMVIFVFICYSMTM
jgi:hypothetical protein